MRVAIVGAGPAGSTLALHLARRGIEVVVLERARFPREKPCGEFVSPLGVRCLTDAGLMETLAAAGALPVDRAAVLFPSGGSVKTPLGSGRTPAATGLTVSRRILDSICLSAAEAAGADVIQGFRVSGIESIDGGTRWRVDGRDATSGPGNIECDLLVGADGVASVVARRLGWLRRSWPQRMGITGNMLGVDMEPGVIEMHLMPGAYCGAVRQSREISHVGLAIAHRRGSWPSGRTPSQILVERLSRFPGWSRRLNAMELAGPAIAFGPMGTRSVRRSGERVLLVGDAAGFLDPVTGHGIGFALRSAELAAATIVEAARKRDLSARSLEAYSRAYEEEFGTAMRFQRRLQRLLAVPSFIGIPLSRLFETHPGALSWLVSRSVNMDEHRAGRRNMLFC